MIQEMDHGGESAPVTLEDTNPHGDTQAVSGWGSRRRSGTKRKQRQKRIPARMARGRRGPTRGLIMGETQERRDVAALPLDAKLQDIIAAVERHELGFAPSTNDRVLSALRTSALRMYGEEDPSKIVVSPDEIDRLWGRGRVRRVPPGYVDLGLNGFKQARRYVRSAVGRYFGKAEHHAALRALDDDWRALRDRIVAAIEDGSLGIRQNLLVAFDVLARIARSARRQPGEIDIAWFESALKEVPTAPRRRTLRDAARLLDDLRLHPDLFVPKLLPPEPLAAAEYAQPRRNARPRPTSLITPLTEWLDKKGRGGEAKGAKRRAGKAVRPNSVKMLKQGAEWYIDVLIDLSLINPEASPTPAEIARADWVKRCVQAEIEEELPWKALSANALFNYAKAAILWLQPYNQEFKHLASEIRKKNAFFSDTGEMTDSHRKWCKAFIRDREKQLVFFDLPLTLQTMAEKALKNYGQLDQIAKAQAINLAIAAAMAAILVNLPLRSSSLEALTVGRGGHVRRPESDRGRLQIVLEPRFVKNNVEINQPIRRKGPVNPREVIDWFMGRPRTLLMQNHMRRAPDPTRLFCGIGYVRLDDCWQFATTAVGLPMTQHLSRHAIASFLINRDEAYLPLVAALLGITPERAKKTYAFVDEGRRARKADDILAQELDILRSGDDDNRPDARGGRR